LTPDHSWPTPDLFQTNSWQTPERLQEINFRSQFGELSPMSSPNLESCNNELSKFGAHLGEATYRNNLDNPDCLLTDSWLTPDRLLKDSKKSILRSQFGELSQWALQIWRAISMSSPNLKLILKVHLGKPGPPMDPTNI
jgi:hypothetical protein